MSHILGYVLIVMNFVAVNGVLIITVFHSLNWIYHSNKF